VKSRSIVAVIFSLLVAVSWTVTARQSSTPSVDDILARYVTAIGGRAAISKHTSRTSKGTLEVVGVTTDGTVESYAKAPNKYLSIINIPDYGQIRRCYDGATGWLSGPDPSNVQLLTGTDLASTRRDANFYQSLDIKKLYPQLSLKEKEDVAGFPAYVVEGDSGEGTVRRLYFDVSSGLLVRNDEITTTAKGQDVVQSFLQDYLDVDGVKQPHTVRQVHGNIIFVIRITEVKMDVPIDDAKFTKPGA